MCRTTARCVEQVFRMPIVPAQSMKVKNGIAAACRCSSRRRRVRAAPAGSRTEFAELDATKAKIRPPRRGESADSEQQETTNDTNMIGAMLAITKLTSGFPATLSAVSVFDRLDEMLDLGLEPCTWLACGSGSSRASRNSLDQLDMPCTSSSMNPMMISDLAAIAAAARVARLLVDFDRAHEERPPVMIMTMHSGIRRRDDDDVDPVRSFFFIMF